MSKLIIKVNCGEQGKEREIRLSEKNVAIVVTLSGDCVVSKEALTSV